MAGLCPETWVRDTACRPALSQTRAHALPVRPKFALGIGAIKLGQIQVSLGLRDIEYALTITVARSTEKEEKQWNHQDDRLSMPSNKTCHYLPFLRQKMPRTAMESGFSSVCIGTSLGALLGAALTGP
jgi:hypothetical protein